MLVFPVHNAQENWIAAVKHTHGTLVFGLAHMSDPDKHSLGVRMKDRIKMRLFAVQTSGPRVASAVCVIKARKLALCGVGLPNELSAWDAGGQPASQWVFGNACCVLRKDFRSTSSERGRRSRFEAVEVEAYDPALVLFIFIVFGGK